MTLESLRKDLEEVADPEKAKFFPRFFKTGPGEYGEGDKFIGVTVPNIRRLAKKYKALPLSDIEVLLKSPIHEERLLALIMLVDISVKGSGPVKKKIYSFYLSNTKYVNNWDLVDSSADKIVGGYLLNKGKGKLNTLAKSKDLWERRIAIMATFYFIKQNQFDKTLEIAEMLVNDDHDLIHKAVGWMLREIGNRDLAFEEKFLKKHYKTMPRTMLRYAIEKFDKEKKDFYMGRA